MRIFSLFPRAAALALAVCVALTLAACDTSDPLAEEDEAPLEGMQRRLLVAESGEASLHVLDVEDGQTVGTLPLAGPIRAYLHAEEEGRYAFLAPTNGPIQTVDAGIYVRDGQVVEEAPSLHDFEVPGENLVHLTYADHMVAGFYDGTGEARFFDARAVTEGEAPDVTTIASGTAHHGAAIAIGPDMALVTKPTEGEALPIGATAYTLPDGSETASFEECPGLHGEAHAADGVVGFGCSDGILVVKRQGADLTSVKVSNPEGLPEGARSGTLRGHADVPYLIAHFGVYGSAEVGPAVYDPASDALTTMEIPGRSPRSNGYAFSPEGRHLLVLGLDGALHVYDAAARTLRGSVSGVAEAVPADPIPDGTLFPTVVAGAHYAYVADPNAQAITEVRLSTQEVTRTWTLDFAPGVMTLTGTDEPLEPAADAAL